MNRGTQLLLYLLTRWTPLLTCVLIEPSAALNGPFVGGTSKVAFVLHLTRLSSRGSPSTFTSEQTAYSVLLLLPSIHVKLSMSAVRVSHLILCYTATTFGVLICINVGRVVLRGGRRDQVVSPELNRTLNLNRLDGFIIIFTSCCVGGYQMLTI